jgi:hypothetical protein
MKRFSIPVAIVLAIVLVAATALAQGTAKKAEPAKAARPALTTYLIESPHTPEECLGVMDEANKAKQLEAWEWGCMSGNHTAYRMVKAADEAAALAMVPESVRSKAKVMKLTKMTAAQLAAAHKAHT